MIILKKPLIDKTIKDKNDDQEITGQVKIWNLQLTFNIHLALRVRITLAEVRITLAEASIY